ncbi:hypothetical protein PYCC9005_001321 [Savitreella phatthalungensis]
MLRSLVRRQVCPLVSRPLTRPLSTADRIVKHPTMSTTPDANPNYILTLACDDKPGIVHAVSGAVRDFDANIIDSAQFGDPSTGKFFMRVHYSTPTADSLNVMKERFSTDIASPFGMTWELHDASVKPRVMLMVSKIGHCLNDLLYRWSTGQLPIDIPLIVSNHKDFYQLAASYNIPFHHLPVNKNNKEAQEERIWELHQEEKIDLVVLARYMQILSPKMCSRVSGKAINIHHSFLPSFKGAKPYFQAFDRGVKLVGSTAHYVTSDLDEGPIIEQGIERVDHTHDVKALTAIGSATECLTLARAVKWHAEHRILMNEAKTVVFR